MPAAATSGDRNRRENGERSSHGQDVSIASDAETEAAPALAPTASLDGFGRSVREEIVEGPGVEPCWRHNEKPKRCADLHKVHAGLGVSDPVRLKAGDGG